MSTRIDLSFTDERLLRDSKRRTAANQQALDDRTQTAKDQQAAEQAAKQATPEERPSAVPDLRLERRPSAQRRKKEEEGHTLFITESGRESIIDSTIQTFSGPAWFYKGWRRGEEIRQNCDIAPYGQFTTSYYVTLETQYQTRETDNYYRDATTEYRIPFSFAGKDVNTQSFTQASRLLTSGTWLLRVFTSVNESIYTCATVQFYVDNPNWGGGISQVFQDTAVTHNPTAFPRTSVRYPLSAEAHQVSSTAEATYVSVLLTERVFSVTNSARFNITSPNLGYTNGDYLRFSAWTENTYGYYVKHDHATGTSQTRIVLLRFSERSVESYPKTFTPSTSFSSLTILSTNLFINNMYNGDPRKAIFTTTGSTSQALNTQLNFVSYNNLTGYGYFIGRNKNPPSSANYVCAVNLGKDLQYAEVLTELILARSAFSNLDEVGTQFNRKSTFSEDILIYIVKETVTTFSAASIFHVAPVRQKT